MIYFPDFWGIPIMIDQLNYALYAIELNLAS
jgi:hypothetical protein